MQNISREQARQIAETAIRHDPQFGGVGEVLAAERERVLTAGDRFPVEGALRL